MWAKYISTSSKNHAEKCPVLYSEESKSSLMPKPECFVSSSLCSPSWASTPLWFLLLPLLGFNPKSPKRPHPPFRSRGLLHRHILKQQCAMLVTQETTLTTTAKKNVRKTSFLHHCFSQGLAAAASLTCRICRGSSRTPGRVRCCPGW